MMKNGKYQRRGAAKRSAGKSIAVLLVLVLVLGCAIGGTIAWLTDTTDEVKNTFTVGDINITLTETPNADSDDEDTENDHWEAKLIPGNTYAKDPNVTVVEGSEDCWLFVKFEKSAGLDDYLTYDFLLDNSDSGWTQGIGTDIPANVWYIEVKSDADLKTWNLLAGNDTYVNGYVTVKDTIVKTGTTTTGTSYVEMPSTSPSMTFTAYACQSANRTVEQAWESLNG